MKRGGGKKNQTIIVHPATSTICYLREGEKPNGEKGGGEGLKV